MLISDALILRRAFVQTFDFQPRTRVIHGAGAIERLGEVARELGARRALLVSDRGLVAAGHVAEAEKFLARAGISVFHFHDFGPNPDSAMIEAGRACAVPLDLDLIIGLGGGSSLDCAKGINFLLTNGGTIKNYRGYERAARPMLPMIGAPTTAGTGSEAQSYALISDAETHAKMACGAPGAAFRVALLDPALTVTQPTHITATAGFDAIAHAVESFVTTKRNPFSDTFAREAWRLLEANYERVLAAPEDLEARAAMQLGACFAGMAIENSMLGATHACANPLTARYGTEHGAAIAALLPTVVRWNDGEAGERYLELLDSCVLRRNGSDAESLALHLEELSEAGGLAKNLRALGVGRRDLPTLARDAAEQWTGRFNPRPFDYEGALEVYEWAY